MNLTRKDIINLALRYISENEIADFPEEEDLYIFLILKIGNSIKNKYLIYLITSVKIPLYRFHRKRGAKKNENKKECHCR